MYLIDTHSHLYTSDFNNDINDVLVRAVENGVQKILLPAIDAETHEQMLALESRYPAVCRAMMGLHPCSVKDNWKEELVIVEKYLQQRKFIAIGEIGLDFYWDTAFSVQQYEAFNIQMQWAMERKLPIVVHTRNAMQETIEAVQPFARKGLRGIFHCFGDDVETAHKIIDMGFLLGIGGVLTYKKSGLAETLKHIDLKHLVLETDAPYLTPVPYRGKRNESVYLKIIAEQLASVKNISIEEVQKGTTSNAEKLFGC
ncbi:MAG: TatD family hydrolase [Sphingobacteriia bacterium]|nr:TatD family hydrolase [Sphingobacteriia bacterium]